MPPVPRGRAELLLDHLAGRRSWERAQVICEPLGRVAPRGLAFGEQTEVHPPSGREDLNPFLAFDRQVGSEFVFVGIAVPERPTDRDRHVCHAPGGVDRRAGPVRRVRERSMPPSGSATPGPSSGSQFDGRKPRCPRDMSRRPQPPGFEEPMVSHARKCRRDDFIRIVWLGIMVNRRKVAAGEGLEVARTDSGGLS